MRLLDKAIYLKKACLTKNKKSILKKVYYSIKEGGIKNLKQDILGVMYAAYKEEYLHNERLKLYNRQQQESTELKGVFGKISIIVCIQDLSSDIKRISRSLEEQVYKNFDVTYLVCKNEKHNISNNSKVFYYDNKIDGNILNQVIDNIESNYFFVIDGNDVLPPNSVLNFVKYSQNDDFILLYSDECIYDFEKNKVDNYLLKPEFSPIYLYNKLYIEHSVLFKKDKFCEYGGFDDNIENLDSLLKSATLNVLKFSKKVLHIEKILLLRDRKYKEIYNHTFNSNMIKKHMNDIGIISNVRANFDNDSYEIDLLVNHSEKISIIVIGECEKNILLCIESIIKNTKWINYEILVVTERQIKANIFKKFSFLENIKFHDCTNHASYAEKCNLGNSKAKGNYIVILKDYIYIEDKNWLNSMAQCLNFKDVGAVSPKIINKYNGIKYSGIISGGYGFFPIPFDGEKNVFLKGYNESAFVTREISIISSSCFMITKNFFDEICGFDEKSIPNEFSNVELSFKIKEYKKTCVFCSNSLVISGKETDEYDSWYGEKSKNGYLYMLKNWIKYLSNDPYCTKSMQSQILNNFPYEFNIYNDESSNHKNNNGRNILIISHELSMTGAPITLQYVVKALIKNGDYPVVLSPKDGKLKDEFLMEGIPVIIDDSIYGTNQWINYAENFDVIIVNTIVQYLNIVELSKTSLPTLWWIHDAREGYELYMKDILPKNIGSNINAYCAGIYAKNVLNDYRDSYDPKVLLYGLPDFSKYLPETLNYRLEDIDDKLVFVTVGTIEKRKGQDVFSKAISSMPKSYIERCKFIFIGKKVSDDIYNSIIDTKNKFSKNIELIDEVKRSDIIDIFKQATCIVCSSRDDPMPVFMTEGMMMSKICICSENTGTATLIEDGINGFVYNNNDYKELLQKIMYVIDNSNNLDSLMEESRKTYEKYFSMDVFDENLLNIIDSIENSN
ncbi:glycosyltransferase [Clostridioides difficile]